MLSRDPAYSVYISHLGTVNTAVVMQSTYEYATLSDLPKRVIQETARTKISNTALPHGHLQTIMTLLENHLEQISLSSAAIAELP